MADTTYQDYIANLQGLNDGLNSVANAATQYATYVQNQANIDWQKEFATNNADEAVRQYEKNFNEAVRQYEKNYAFNAAEMQRVQQNFENQHQISVADAQKAGINPLALYGLNASGSVSSPTSSVSATSGVGGSNNVNQNRPMSNPFVSSMANMLLGQKFEASENAKDRQTSKEIATMQEKTKQDESMLNYLASSESNSILRLRVNNEKELTDRKLEVEREANLLLNDRELRKVVNDTKRVGIEEFNSVQKVIQDNLALQMQVNRLNFEYIRLQTETDRANKDRRERYINSELDRLSKHIDTLIHADSDITKSVLSMMIFKGK